MSRRPVAFFLCVALGAPLAFAQAPGSKPAKPATAKEAAVAPGTEAVVETPKGRFTIRLLPEVAPKHVALFVRTAKAGGYDGTTFHRIIMGGSSRAGTR